MYSTTELAIKYLNYAWRASNGKGHGIHSPFVYEFVVKVLNDHRNFYPYAEIEKRRSALQKDHRMISIEDRAECTVAGGEVKIADIAQRSLSSKRFGQLLFRIVNYYQPENIIELGTSLGISGAYLAAASPDSSLVTLEGNPSISQIAAETFRMLNLKNIRQVTGKFDNTLSDVISSAPPSDLVFIDGNHRKEPTLKYFRQFLNKKSVDSIFIFHDIHWSREMEEAWRIIRDHQEVMITIDLFSAGFIFFGESFRVKQDFIIRF